MNPVVFFSTPVVQYATTAEDAPSIKHLPGMMDSLPKTLPQVGDVIKAACFVDPSTGAVLTVRVVDILNMPERQPPTIAVMVKRVG